MAGHSKWANIRHRKGRADAQKGKLFSRLTKEIISATKLGGPDPKSNSRLRLAIARAKAFNLPNDNIERSIKRGSSTDQANFDEIVYEIYGFGGVGLLVEAMTDNKNRSASDIRTVLGKRGGSMAIPGAVSFNFDNRGVIQVGAEIDEEKLLELAIEVGADDIEVNQEGSFMLSAPQALYAVKDKLEEAGVLVIDAQRQWIARHLVACTKEDFEANMALFDALEALEDVNELFHNMELSP